MTFETVQLLFILLILNSKFKGGGENMIDKYKNLKPEGKMLHFSGF